MSIARWLASSAARTPAAPALYRGDQLFADYEDFALRVASAAGRLRDRGVGPGDRVALYLRNDIEYVIAMWSVWWVGAAVVPLNAKLHYGEVVAVLEDAEPAALLTDDRGASLFTEAVGSMAHRDSRVRCPIVDVYGGFVDIDPTSGTGGPADRRDDDLAWLFYTSGTTGTPKGVMLDHSHLVAMSMNYMTDVDHVDSADTAVYAAPLSHGAGLYCPVHVRRGARHCVPASRGFDAGEILDLARELGSVSFFAAPTMVRRLTAEARRYPDRDPAAGIKTIVYGGGPMYLADIEAAMAVFGNRFVQIYGQGESPMTITTLSRADHLADSGGDKLTTVGSASSAVDVRVVDELGAPQPTGTVGEIVVAGATVMRGYWRNDEATTNAVRGGWLRTGDRGYFDGAGYLTLAGRSKEVIVSGGTNIYPREVEDVLVAHPGVAEAAVIGIEDREWGERVAALVVLELGALVDAADLDSHCVGSLARFKRPRRYLFVDDLPKNAYGKVARLELPEIFRSAVQAAIADV